MALSGGSGDALLDVVMLVDESGSETTESVMQERQVAATIGQSMLNPASRVTVVGFGGVNGVAPDQNPVDVACKPTIASSAQNLAFLSTCANSLHRRTEAEGNDTDYAAALGQAMSYLNPDSAYGKQSPPGALKVILMMTDGGVDVHRDTKQYGPGWLAGVHQAVNEQLDLARQDHVEVWTLGMGSDISGTDQQYLQYLASNGAQSTCKPEPHSTLVTNRAQALTALNQLYAQAGCLGSSVSPWIPIGGSNPSGTLQVTIPAIASDAAISVDRGDPGVQVSYYQPDGKLWTDSSAISGTGSAVDVLHLTDPAPGTWKIKLTAPPGLKNELVSSTAFWQGAVRALITANPPSAQPGQTINVSLSVLGNHGPINDPSTVKNLQVGVTVSGDGLTQAPVTVSNAGETGSSGTGVANYVGHFTAPKATGTLTFNGTAQGYGLYATNVPASVQVSNVPNAFGATVQLPTAVSVQAGSGLQGHVIFSNPAGGAKTVRLVLGDVSNAHATITSPGGPVTVRSGSPPPEPFTISFAKDSPTGSAWLTVKVVDAANPGVVYANAPLNVTVTKPPGFFARYLWVIVGVIVLIALIILAILLLRAARRARLDVRSLRAEISHDGEQRGQPLRPPGTWSDTFSFVIRDEDNKHARLELPQPGASDPTYVAKRNGSGQVRVWTPVGEERDIVVGSIGELLQNGLRLAFRDIRKRGSGWHVPFVPDPSKKKSPRGRPQPAAPQAAAPPGDDWGSPAPQAPAQPASQTPTQTAWQVPTQTAPQDDDWM